MYVDTTNGRIGINTASPTVSLEVHGDDGVYFDAHPMLEGIEIVSGALMATQHIMHKQHQRICLHLQILETGLLI